MKQRIHDTIRHLLETTPGLTQRGLAERMNLNPAAVNRMLYGNRNIRAEEIPVIEDYLGVKLDLSAPTVEPKPARRGFSDVPQAALHAQDSVVPVYGYAAGSLVNGLNLGNGDVVDWVVRHPAQFGIPGAFAIYVFSDSMEPRYFRGELVYIHPGRPPAAGSDCVIEMKNGDAYLKRFVRQNEDKIRVGQFNPPQEADLPRADIRAVYSVVGRG